MLNHTSTSHGSKREVLKYALLGVGLSLALHAYYVANWDRYAASVSASRMAQLGGVVPRAHIAGTKLSARDGAAALLVSGAVVALAARRRYWIGCSSFAGGAAAASIILGVASGQIRGNLAPLGVMSVLLLVLIPIGVGGAIGGGLRTILRRRTSAAVGLFALLMTGGLFVGCASAPSPAAAAAPAAAEISLAFLRPEPGSELTRTSIIEAGFIYQLSNMKSRNAIYTLEPAFSDRRGAGFTFNAVTGPADVITLTTTGGRVELRYPILREWTNSPFAAADRGVVPDP